MATGSDYMLELILLPHQPFFLLVYEFTKGSKKLNFFSQGIN